MLRPPSAEMHDATMAAMNRRPVRRPIERTRDSLSRDAENFSASQRGNLQRIPSGTVPDEIRALSSAF